MPSKRSTEARAPEPPVRSSDRGVYVHFPYCAKKCPYCDFNSHAIDHDDHAYADVVLRELAHRADRIDGPLRSIYFGGGTPSRWAPDAVGRVIDGLSERLGLTPNAEITLEANPGTVAEDRMHAYVAKGVTRFSIGVQSFIDRELVALGRIHDAAAAERAVRLAKATGAKVSLDLIYAQPNQTVAEVDRSIDRALELETNHISAYTLTVEPDTTLGRRARLGLFKPMPDDDQAGLIEHVTARLGAAGLVRYEVSNYAAPGDEAIHNSLYWVGAPYLGLGAGAHGFVYPAGLASAYRYENVKPPEHYLEGRFDVSFDETQDRRAIVADRLWVGLRPRWGLDLHDLAVEAEWSALESLLAPTFERLVERGLLDRDRTRFFPTTRGFLFADTIARTMLDAAAELDTNQ